MSFQPKKRMFVAIGTALLTQQAAAAVTYELAPSLSVAAVHDSNLFLTPEPTIDDRITRYTGRLELNVDGDAVDVSALYSQDAEYYADYDQFDSGALRRSGTAQVTFHPSERLSWGIDGTYFKTPQPGDLNFGVGLVQLGRVPTTQRSIGGRVEYAVSPTLDTRFSYTALRDETDLGIGGDTNEARAEFDKALSARNTFLFGYTYRNFEFTNDTEQDTHTLMAGVDHQLRPNTNVRVLVGPRFYDDSVEPNLEAALTHEFATGEVRATYTRGETLLSGTDVRVESQLANLVYVKRFGRDWEFSVQPAWASVDSPFGAQVDVFQIGADVTYSFNDYISVSAATQISRQDEDINGFDRDVPRDVFIVSLNFTWPIRGTRP
jgi:hypothetical protein